jgi:DNA-binding XRE family transcriptional regulator
MDPNLQRVCLETFSDIEHEELLQFMRLSHKLAKSLDIDVETLFTRGMTLLEKSHEARQKSQVLATAGLNNERELTIQAIITV